MEAATSGSLAGGLDSIEDTVNGGFGGDVHESGLVRMVEEVNVDAVTVEAGACGGYASEGPGHLLPAGRGTVWVTDIHGVGVIY